MDHKWLMILLVGAVLLAGCASAPSNAAANANGGASDAGTAGAVANANGGSGAGTPSGSGANASTGSGAQAGSNAGNEAQALGLMALQALGTPAQCTVKEAGQPDVVLYIQGSNLRAESQVVQDNTTYPVISVIRGGVFYVDTGSFGSEARGCDWIEFKANASQTGASGNSQAPFTAGIDEQTLSDLPPADFSCAPAVFGDEKFQTPGKVCSLTDIMAQAFQNSGVDVNASEGGATASINLTDDEKQQLVQACASISDAPTRQALGCPS